MSAYEYEISKMIAQSGAPFYALIMAAMRQADTVNLSLLRSVFPDVEKELLSRYNAPGGTLSGDGVREGDQQLPVKNNRLYIQDLVVADIEARKQVGIARYGTALQAHNGRDALRDLYEELIDACMYVRQLMEERDETLDSGA
jgi:hypothetical protein